MPYKGWLSCDVRSPLHAYHTAEPEANGPIPPSPRRHANGLMRARDLGLVALCAFVLAAAYPRAAAAHGLFERLDLPIPQSMFWWAAGIVLVVSFVGLGALWRRPKLAGAPWRPLPAAVSRAVAGSIAQAACGACGVLLLIVVVWSGLAGIQVPESNFAPTFVYVVFWVGLVPVSVLLGNVYRALNPWRALARAFAGLVGQAIGKRPRAPLEYPERVGVWPAAAGLVSFGVLELVAYGGIEPRNVALATLVYSAATLAGMALFGIEPWLARGEAFSVYFGLFAGLSIFETRDGRLGVRPPLTGLAGMPREAGMPALLAVMIGAVTFDGATEGPLGEVVVPRLQRLAEALGLGTVPATQLALALALAVTILAVLAFFRLGVAGARSAAPEASARHLAAEFAPSLVPIAFAYVVAHYLTLLVYQGQAIVFLASDPLGNGSNLFGTADMAINHDIMDAKTGWYAQVGVVVSGHVVALTLAHERAVALFKRARDAIRSQCWMLAVMIGFTMLALWLLSEANV